jgi:hypothetical protein
MAEPTDQPPPPPLESGPKLLTPEQVVEELDPRSNGNGQVGFERHLLAVLTRFKSGDFTSRMPNELT